jgi:hypothetical protein
VPTTRAVLAAVRADPAPVTIFRFRKGARNTTGSAFFQDADVLATILPPPAAVPPP